MPNGKVHDHPITDTVVHGLHPFPPDLEDLVLRVHAQDPGVVNDLEGAPFDWENGQHLPEARLLLSSLLEHPGEQMTRRRLVQEYQAATSRR
jgi:hypothetical protein